MADIDHSWDFKHNLMGSIVVAPEVRKTRKDICVSCDKLNSWNVCTMCNCLMTIKTWVSFSKCPLDKWQAVKTLEEATNPNREDENG